MVLAVFWDIDGRFRGYYCLHHQGDHLRTDCYMIREVITLLMEAVITSETSVNIYHTTRRDIADEAAIFMLVAVRL
jgi:hypothetical protein